MSALGLGQQQAALVRALVGAGQPPAGFDPAALAATAAALLRKRAHEVARRYPLLRYEVGDRYQELFCAWATDRPRTSTHADARAFADYVGMGSLQKQTRIRWLRLLRT